MILDGKEVSKQLYKQLKEVVDSLKSQPRIDVILVGEDPASSIYVRNKIKKAQELGIKAVDHLFTDITEEELIELIDNLNNNDEVDGILVQLPLPKNIDEEKILNKINDNKDVDGFHLLNAGRLFKRYNALTTAATPKGIMKLIDYYNIDLTGLNAVVIGRSNIVGMPISKLLLDRNATVTVCHSKTKDIAFYTKNADLIVCALGIPKFLTKDKVKKDSIIIDVGINRVNNKLVGDADFENLENVVKYITPVPGGIGPMTIYALFDNLIELHLARKGNK